MPKEGREATSLDGGKLISLRPWLTVYTGVMHVERVNRDVVG